MVGLVYLEELEAVRVCGLESGLQSLEFGLHLQVLLLHRLHLALGLLRCALQICCLCLENITAEMYMLDV